MSRCFFRNAFYKETSVEPSVASPSQTHLSVDRATVVFASKRFQKARKTEVVFMEGQRKNWGILLCTRTCAERKRWGKRKKRLLLETHPQLEQVDDRNVGTAIPCARAKLVCGRLTLLQYSVFLMSFSHSEDKNTQWLVIIFHFLSILNDFLPQLICLVEAVITLKYAMVVMRTI